KPAQPAGPERRRPSQSERRTEIVVVGVHSIRLQEVVGVEAGKSREAQRVCGLSELLIAEPQCQAQRWRRQPRILEKVDLAELIGMENSRAKSSPRAAGRSAEIVQEVGESGVACRVGVRQDSLGVGGGKLGR